MADTLKVTFDWRATDTDMPERLQETVTQNAFQELRRADGINAVNRVADPDVPEGSMGAQWLWGLLTAEIPGDGIKLALKEVFDRLPGKPMNLSVEVDGKKIELGNVRPDDLDAVSEKMVALAQKLKDV